MRIEDLTLLVGSLILSAGLLPSLFSGHKPSKWTSLTTCLVVASFLWVDLRLGLPLAAAAQGFGIVLWLSLFCQMARKKETR